jgi:hypothetical protein
MGAALPTVFRKTGAKLIVPPAGRTRMERTGEFAGRLPHVVARPGPSINWLIFKSLSNKKKSEPDSRATRRSTCGGRDVFADSRRIARLCIRRDISAGILRFS